MPPARARIRDTIEVFKRCGKSGCRMCPFTGLQHGQLQKYGMVSSLGEEIPIRGNLTCHSSKLLYIDTCEIGSQNCPQNQYVGETGQTGEKRCSEHRNNVVQVCQQGIKNTSKARDTQRSKYTPTIYLSGKLKREDLLTN